MAGSVSKVVVEDQRAGVLRCVRTSSAASRVPRSELTDSVGLPPRFDKPPTKFLDAKLVVRVARHQQCGLRMAWIGCETSDMSDLL